MNIQNIVGWNFVLSLSFYEFIHRWNYYSLLQFPTSSLGMEEKFKGDLREHLHWQREGIICQGRLLHFFVLHNAQLSWYFSKLKHLTVSREILISKKLGKGLWVMLFNSGSLTYLLPTVDLLFFAYHHKNLVFKLEESMWLMVPPISPQYSSAENIPISAWFPSSQGWHSRSQWSSCCLPLQHHILSFLPWTLPCNRMFFSFPACLSSFILSLVCEALSLPFFPYPN